MSDGKNILKPEGLNELVIFQGSKVRSVKYAGEWWYSVIDIIEILTDSTRPRKYWNDLKTQLEKEGSQLSGNIGQLKMAASDGKERLTDAISVETFGVKTARHKNLKGLKKHHNLRDNMTGLELLFTSLAEQSAKSIAKARNAHGYIDNEKAAKAGGKIAGDARKNLELVSGESVLSDKNYLTAKERGNMTDNLPENHEKLNKLLNPQTNQ